jgi:hypothetical protein
MNCSLTLHTSCNNKLTMAAVGGVEPKTDTILQCPVWNEGLRSRQFAKHKRRSGL